MSAALLVSLPFLPIAHTVTFQVGHFSIAGWWEPVEVIREPWYPIEGNPALEVARLARRGVHTLKWHRMSLEPWPNVGYSVRVGWLTWALAWTHPDDGGI
jgi:hypothetical protein